MQTICVSTKKENDKMIYSTLQKLITDKSFRERRKLSYRTISEETGISTGTLVRLCDFNGIKKINANTIEVLCDYFGCEVGDLLKCYKSPADKGITDPWKIAGQNIPDDFPLPDVIDKE